MRGFETIVGNEQIKQHFLHAIESGKISHCYILSGEDGMGKMMIAKQFAQMLQCECETKENRPCMVCHSCRQFLSGNHPDIIYVGHEKPTVIGVDDVRTGVVGDMQTKPYSSPYKIYIMDEAEKLSVQAQNALLKTIEEPPSYGIIMLLTTNAAALLDTIRSRSIILNMKPVSDEEMVACLHSKNVEEAKIDTLVKFSRGNIGKAIKMANAESFSDMIEVIMHLLKNAYRMEFSDLLEYITALEEYKLDINDCLGFMQMWYRDVLLLKATNDVNLLLFQNEYQVIREVAKRSGYEGIEQIIDAIDTARRRLDANVNFSLTMELLWLTIRDNQG